MTLIKELYAYRQMIVSLVRKELRGRYKGSVLGFMWTFINPLLQLVVYTLVFSVLLRNNIDKYYLFLFVALIPWIFFSTSLTGGSSCVLSQQGMVTKIYFPREVLPISYVTTAFVNMLLCFIVIFAVILGSGIGINFVAILYLPLIMILEYFMALGVAMISSAITVFFRDMEHILGILGMVWMYMTPIMYDVSIVPERLQPIFYLNPMTSIIIAYRDILYYKQVPHVKTLFSAFLFGIFTMLIGIFVFGKLKRKFAEEL